MIVGRGMLAKAFKDFSNSSSILIYASGVSNSKETRKHCFEKERRMVEEHIANNQNKIFVYFSTCSIEDKSLSNSPYIIHKQTIEDIIKNSCKKFYIFRLPQVVGHSNSPTLVNFLVHAILNNQPFEVYQNATRNLIDVTDVFKICKLIITKEYHVNCTINIATPFNKPVLDIVHLLEKLLQKKATYSLLDIGERQIINIDLLNELKIPFESNYCENVLTKYLKNRCV